MGCEKHIRANRRPRLVKPDLDSSDKDASLQNPNLNSNPNADEYCTEEQLEEMLLKSMESVYNEAVSKLVALGYDEDVALKAILRNGHCYGGMDVLTNILHNSLAYLNSNAAEVSTNEDLPHADPIFSDLKKLEEYSLAGMLCLLQQVKPHFSKSDAMCCLLMNDLHVGRASI